MSKILNRTRIPWSCYIISTRPHGDPSWCGLRNLAHVWAFIFIWATTLRTSCNILSALFVAKTRRTIRLLTSRSILFGYASFPCWVCCSFICKYYKRSSSCKKSLAFFFHVFYLQLDHESPRRVGNPTLFSFISYTVPCDMKHLLIHTLFAIAEAVFFQSVSHDRPRLYLLLYHMRHVVTKVTHSLFRKLQVLCPPQWGSHWPATWCAISRGSRWATSPQSRLCHSMSSTNCIRGWRVQRGKCKAWRMCTCASLRGGFRFMLYSPCCCTKALLTQSPGQQHLCLPPLEIPVYLILTFSNTGVPLSGNVSL